MRPALAILVFSALLAPTAAAQTVHATGARSGLNVSAIDSRFEGYGMRTGVQVAAFLELTMTEDLTVVGELEYAQRGYTFTAERRNDAGQVIAFTEPTTRLDYLSVPVVFRIRARVTDRLAIYALGGPRLDVLVGRRPGAFDLGTGEQEDPLAAALSTLGGNIAAGAGAAIREVLGHEVRLETRFVFGMTNLVPDDHPDRVFVRSIDLNLVVAL
jgi:hypothetical protein